VASAPTTWRKLAPSSGVTENRMQRFRVIGDFRALPIAPAPPTLGCSVELCATRSFVREGADKSQMWGRPT
jgi:hypothetical protein